MKGFLLFSVIFISLNFNAAHGQSASYSGNLLRIHFSSAQVNPADTLGSWSEWKYDSANTRARIYTKYFEHLTTPLQGYFLGKYENYVNSPLFVHEDKSQLIQTDKFKGSRNIGILPTSGWDVPEPYMLGRTILSKTKNGFWLNNGAFGNAFLTNDDSLYFYDRFYKSNPSLQNHIRAIIGKVNNKYMAVFADSPTRSNYLYYLINPDDSPAIDSSKSARISVKGDSTFIKPYPYPNTIARIRQLSGDLYALSSEKKYGIDIVRFADSSLYFQKTLLTDELNYVRDYRSHWEIRNGKLFLLNIDKLLSFELNPADTSFKNRKILLDNLTYPDHYSLEGIEYNFGFDRNLKFAAIVSRGPKNMFQDTLKIYDIDQEKVINTIVLNNIKDPFLPIVDSPYVYVHQILKRSTGIAVFKKTIPEDYTLSAYPNPFNPAVTIRYSVPKESHVTVRIFDILGREVSVLVNMNQPAGEYKVQFTGTSLPSGTYICSLQNGEYLRNIKLLLLK